MHDTWSGRDLPVLDAMVELSERGLAAIFNLNEVAQLSNIPIIEVGKAARVLSEAGLIDLRMTMTGGDPGPWHVTNVSAKARQLTGAWPSADSLAARLIEVLEKQAEEEVDPARKKVLRKILGRAGEATRSILVEILSGAIAKSLSGTL